MQQTLHENRHNLPRFRVCSGLVSAAVGIAALMLVAGCGGDSSPPTDPNAKTFGKVALTVRCADPAFTAAITPTIRSWAERTGATVAVESAAMAEGDNTDVGIIPARELGLWA